MTIKNWEYKLQSNRFVGTRDTTYIDLRDPLDKLKSSIFNMGDRPLNAEKTNRFEYLTDSNGNRLVGRGDVDSLTREAALEKHYTSVQQCFAEIKEKGIKRGFFDSPSDRQSTLNFFNRDITHSIAPDNESLEDGSWLNNKADFMVDLVARQNRVCPNASDPSSFYTVINNSDYNSKVAELGNFRNQLGTYPEFKERFREIQNHSLNYLEDLSQSQEYVSFIEKLSNVFKNYDLKTLNEITQYVQLNEQVALVLFEPTLLYVVGPALFMHFVLPLHRDLAFTMVIKDAIAMKTIKQTFTYQYGYVYMRFTDAIITMSDVCARNRNLIFYSSTILATVTGTMTWLYPTAGGQQSTALVKQQGVRGFQGALGENLRLFRKGITVIKALADFISELSKRRAGR